MKNTIKSDKKSLQKQVAQTAKKEKELSPAEKVYSQAIKEIREFISNIQKAKTSQKGLTYISDLVNLIRGGNQEIIALADKSTQDAYLYGHCVNVSIFSIIIGDGLKFNVDKLERLGTCAALKNIGMVRVMDIASKNGSLKKDELEKIKEHKSFGQEMVRNFLWMSEDLQELLQGIMDRIELFKTGPSNSISSTLSEEYEFSRIIFVAEVYEAITHARSYRDRFLPYPTLKTMQALMQNNKFEKSLLPHEALRTMLYFAVHDFDADIIKVFVDKISLFPPGSFVRLNTDQIAKVVSVNRGMPSRPTVLPIIDAESKRMLNQHAINLSENQLIFITEPIDETKLKIQDQQWKEELISSRWWNE
ncbi:MAG: hypothetical protein NT145_01550 [Elusimicrobia bacterium]|nr:hypothetical protein [Elusimicrobiota bacterium]